MILIDGHNVLHHIPDLYQAFKSDSLSGMVRLVGLVLEQRDTIVVFDGKMPSKWHSSASNVVFAESVEHRYERADRYILDYLNHHADVEVVTQDGALASSCRQKRAKVTDPNVWYQRFLKSRERSKSTSIYRMDGGKKGPGGSPSEWVKLFTNRTENPDDT